MFFENYVEFVDSDIRKHRAKTPVTVESLDQRCKVLLPPWFVKDKTILDLGHCVGAFGHWALAHGAKHYTGLDIQQSFCDKSQELLSKHWDSSKFEVVNSDVIEYLKTTDKKYDIVIACGILHGYLDFYTVLKSITDVCDYVVFESIEIEDDSTTPKAHFQLTNMVSDTYSQPYHGVTCLLGYNALRIVMRDLGFDVYGERIYPEPIAGSHDAYNDDVNGDDKNVKPKRFMVRYMKTNKKVLTLQSKIRENVKTYREAYNDIDKNVYIPVKKNNWQFDESVAQRFQQEAHDHIPDYDRVIDLCLDIANNTLNKDSVIIDVGSALGHTVDSFINHGYTNTFGVEASEAMRVNSLHQDKIILSDTFPNINADMVIINWTLHFIKNADVYLKSVFDSMNGGGILVLTDKTAQSDLIKKLYYNFKRSNRVSEEYIKQKELQLQGYMNNLPIEWYLTILKEIGFDNIQIINNRLGFATFYCEK